MDTQWNRHLTPTGIGLYACAVVLLLVGFGTRQLLPGSAIGSFLGSVVGAVMALVAWWLAFTVLYVVLTMSGRPCLTADDSQDVQRSATPPPN